MSCTNPADLPPSRCSLASMALSVLPVRVISQRNKAYMTQLQHTVQVGCWRGQGWGTFTLWEAKGTRQQGSSVLVCIPRACVLTPHSTCCDGNPKPNCSAGRRAPAA